MLPPDASPHPVRRGRALTLDGIVVYGTRLSRLLTVKSIGPQTQETAQKGVRPSRPSEVTGMTEQPVPLRAARKHRGTHAEQAASPERDQPGDADSACRTPRRCQAGPSRVRRDTDRHGAGLLLGRRPEGDGRWEDYGDLGGRGGRSPGGPAGRLCAWASL